MYKCTLKKSFIGLPCQPGVRLRVVWPSEGVRFLRFPDQSHHFLHSSYLTLHPRGRILLPLGHPTAVDQDPLTARFKAERSDHHESGSLSAAKDTSALLLEAFNAGSDGTKRF